MNISELDPAVLERARTIRLLVLDVDGVMTNGQLMFSNSGDEMKAFNALDGHGIKMLQNTGVRVAIITGRSSEIVARRAKALGIKHLIQGREDKLSALDELLSALSTENTHVNHNEIAYMGDDYPDLAIIRRVGLGMTPANGHWVIKEHAHWNSTFNGGEGAVRQACDLLMLAQESFDDQLKGYL